MGYDAGEARQQAQAISNAMTRLHHEHVGRGPNAVRTIVGHDHVICFLEDLYTQVERTLLDGGEEDAVKESRLAFQRTMESKFVEMIESNTGRSVRQLMSQVSFDPDISVEIFVLHPVDGETVPDGVA
jgi:uncharacterized protein YbcI